jgi:hypothetical protein
MGKCWKYVHDFSKLSQILGLDKLWISTTFYPYNSLQRNVMDKKCIARASSIAWFSDKCQLQGFFIWNLVWMPCERWQNQIRLLHTTPGFWLTVKPFIYIIQQHSGGFTLGILACI